MDSVVTRADAQQQARFAEYWPIAAQALGELYGRADGFERWLQELREAVIAAAAQRPSELRDRDQLPSDTEWWAAETVVGYSAYVDRFAGTLRELPGRLDYLQELGVSYLHLLPLMKPRQGESDGGYAVADFEDVDPALGSLADFRALIGEANERGIRIVIDLVCNHTADDHNWALAARQGDPRYRDYYHFHEDPAQVDALERHLIDVFPKSAPGNFTYVAERAAWVWTTFYPFQWDLNYSNPAVFRAMSEVLFNLANMGIAGFRLDSTAFLWKRPGTSCRNLPEVHGILTAWRALLSIVAPGVVLKAEAIERLEEVLPYFGAADGSRECDLAYNNGVMAALWASLALGTAAPAYRLIDAAAAKPAHGVWVNYVRCHDDIIFSALSPFVPKALQRRAALQLAGQALDSFSDGRVFQEFDGVPSINGMAASLAGREQDHATRQRLRLLYGVTFALGGLPVIYMGDELALENDLSYEADPARSGEGRWIQRPSMDWRRAAEGAASGSLAGLVRDDLARLARTRAENPAFHAHAACELAEGQPEALLAFIRGAGAEAVQVVANFSMAATQARVLLDSGRGWRDLLSSREGTSETIELAPYDVLWLRGQR